MDIIGQRIRHKTLGTGKVIAFSGERVIIRFDNDATERKYIFPDSFKEHLIFTNPTLQNQVTAIIPKKHSKKSVSTTPSVTQEPQRRTGGNTQRNNNNQETLQKSRLNSFTGTIIPSSAIMQVCITGKGKKYVILVVDDDKQQNSTQGIYWKNRELSKKIVEASFSGKNVFSFDGIDYTVEAVKKYPKYNTFRNRWDRLENNSEAKELYVFKQKGIYDDPANGYELVDAKLYFPQKRQEIKATLYYQASLNRFFMNEESFIPLVRAHGLPRVNLHFTEDTSNPTSWTGTFNEYSKLKMLGYNVQQSDGMSAAQRQNLLNSIIRSGQMTDAEVANHLEMLIHLNSGKLNMANACGSWKADLKYIHDSFGDMRKQKDFYNSYSASSKKTAKAPASTSGSARSAQSIPSYKQRYSPYTPESANAYKPSYDSKSITSPVNNRTDEKKRSLLEQREILNAELQAAKGLFHIFKRMRIKREIERIDAQLRLI